MPHAKQAPEIASDPTPKPAAVPCHESSSAPASIAAARATLSAQHNRLQPVDLVWPEGERASGSHLHAGPAIFVVARGDHCDRGAIERELREIGHR